MTVKDRGVAALLILTCLFVSPEPVRAGDTMTNEGYYALREEWRNANLYKQKKLCERATGTTVSMRGRVLVVQEDGSLAIDLDDSLSLPDVLFHPVLKTQIENVQPGDWIRFSGTVSDCVGHVLSRSLHLTIRLGLVR